MHASDPTDHSTTDAQRALREEIKDLIVTTLRMENVNPQDIGDTELLFSPDARLGLDSLAAVAVKNDLEAAFGVPLPASATFDHPSVRLLARYLDQQIAPS